MLAVTQARPHGGSLIELFLFLFVWIDRIFSSKKWKQWEHDIELNPFALEMGLGTLMDFKLVWKI